MRQRKGNGFCLTMLLEIIVGILVALGYFFTLPGCNAVPAAMPREFAQAAQTLSTSISDQAIWDEIKGDIRGHALNPGLRVYAGILYVAGTNIEGFDGDVGLGGKAHGSGELSPEARQAILDINNPDPARRKFALEVLDRLSKSMNKEPESEPAPEAPPNGTP